MFFDKLGRDYRAFNRKHRAYDIFRCGMVHEYFVKASSYGISLGHTNVFPFVHDPDPTALHEYLFHVSLYVDALEAAFDRLAKAFTFPLVRTRR